MYKILPMITNLLPKKDIKKRMPKHSYIYEFIKFEVIVLPRVDVNDNCPVNVLF